MVFGTRPEAIKMAPIALELLQSAKVDLKIILTGQHREMLDSVLGIFQLPVFLDLSVMSAGQSLATLTSKIISGLDVALAELQVDILLVHGDTTTSFAAALVAFYHKIPVGHIEAGLRTGDVKSPWPEEANRCLTSKITEIHFAPTSGARNNLLKEGVLAKDILVTGNTVIDALLWVKKRYLGDKSFNQRMLHAFPFLRGKDYILVTGHRRESFGQGFQNICEALTRIARLNPDLLIVYPVHLNPSVKGIVHQKLAPLRNIILLPPQSYLEFCFLMDNCRIVLTDSGGIQEEAPSLGKPVLVMRGNTERPEALESGTAKLVGTNTEGIVSAVSELLGDGEKYTTMSKAHNPYGDGLAARRIVQYILRGEGDEII